MSWKKEFALCMDNCPIKMIRDSEFGKGSVNLYRGMMVQVYERLPNRKCSIKVCDFHGEDPVFVENLFLCSLSHLLIVSADLWPFLIGITEPLHRLDLAKDRDLANFIICCNTDHIVHVTGTIFGRDQPYTCIVRFIGLVPELGPGYYFGLEILTLENGYSPQAEVFDFLSRYVSCDQNLALIVSASHIRPIPKDKRRDPETFLKRSVNGITCGAVEIAKTFDRHISSKLINKTKQHQQQNDKFSPPQSRSSFYVVPDINVINKSISTEHLSLAGEHEDSTTTTTMAERNSNSKKVIISKSTPNLDKQDSGSSTGSSGHRSRNLQNEDFVRHVENYERNLEKKRNRRTSSSGSGNGASTNSHGIAGKPGTIMSLEDRDLIIIDKTDINEAIGNHSDVIIVDPPTLATPPHLPTQSEMDLSDILGQDWPAAAGDMAPLLNNDKKAQIVRGTPGSVSGSSTNTSSTGSGGNYLKFERNKSLNPVSHLVSTTKPAKEMRDFSATTEFVNGYHHKRSNSNHLDHHHVLPTPIVDNTMEPFIPTPLNDIPGTGLGIGSMVEVSTDISENLYGVIRWIGSTQSGTSTRIIVGVELEDDQSDRPLELTDGVYNGMRLFRCPPGRALFVPPSQCTKDRRFADDHYPNSINHGGGGAAAKSSKATTTLPDPKMFGQVDCPVVEGSIPPLQILKNEDLNAVCGKYKGIQGHHNSCYLDATLFAMFTFTSVFDSLLYRPREPEDNVHYDEVQKVLREEIVNPLRKNMYVRADRVMKLRQLLDKLSSVTGLTNEEKDPEEFLNCLLAQIMRAEPFLKLSSGLDAFYYQLFVEKDERLNLPSVQQLFEQSFLQSDIKLKEVPSCLIIQMPRFGKSYKMYPRILPSQVLDVTDVIEDSPRQCTVCGKLAEYECRECFGMLQCGVGLESTSFCKKCLETAHSHAKRLNHKPNPLQVPQDFKIMAEHCPVPRLFMELFAVVCIETSHYVAFVKAGSGSDAPWCFFDSMADRKGEQNGYNIPEMVPVPDLHQWLSEDGARSLNEFSPNDKMLPEHARRLLCDAYMCMYQSTDVMMYR